MYSVISRYFEDNGYLMIVDNPKGSGIKFALLKGWTIDVTGKKEDEIVAVEAKNNLGAQSVIQAISQAEMYRSACTRVYVAFPNSELESKDNQDVLHDIKKLCQARGVGLLSIGRFCKEIIPAQVSLLKIVVYTEILDQFILKSLEFQGFNEKDFVSYHSNEDVIWHKFQLFCNEVEKRMVSKQLILTRKSIISKWWITFSKEVPESGKYWHVPHFSISFWGNGVMVELITRQGRYLNRLVRKINDNQRKFIQILKDLKKGKFDYKISILEREHVGGYETEIASKYEVNSNFLESNDIQRVIEHLTDKKRSRKIWFQINHLFHLSEKMTQSSDLVNSIGMVVDDLFDLYDFISTLN